MRLAALFSGGKDSTYALYLAMKQGHEIKFLVTISPKKEDSWMFHYPCIEFTKLQAEAMGIKQIWKESSGEKENELKDLMKAILPIKNDIDGIVSGAIASQYQRSRIDSVCRELGLANLAPLWQRNYEELLKEEINEGLEIIITSVSTGGLDKNWLGKKLNMHVLEELKVVQRKNPFNIAFEGGEAETFVTDCPIFKKKILIENFQKKWDNRTGSGYIVVESASLARK